MARKRCHEAYDGDASADRERGFHRRPHGAGANLRQKAHTSALEVTYFERPTTYLLGQVDVLPLGGFDSSPSGMAQSPTRRARGEAFFNYVTETLGAKHNAIIVPECGHNDRCIFTSDVVLPVIFPQ